MLYQNIVSRFVYKGIEFVFDNKEKVKERVQSHFNRVKELLDEMPDYRWKLESCSFRDDREVIPLQAADLLAYEVRRRIWERLKNPDAPVRDAYQRIKDSFALRPTEPPSRRIDALRLKFAKPAAQGPFISMDRSPLSTVASHGGQRAQAFRDMNVALQLV